MRLFRIIMILFIGCGLLVMACSSQVWAQAQEQESETSPGQVQAQSEATDTGNVSLDFKNADIRSVLKVIAYKSGINIVATPEVRGVVTIRLQDVHWEKALDTIVMTYGFGYEWLNDKVIMVSTLERLAEQRKIQEEAAANEPVDTQTYTLNFVKAEEIKITIEKLISGRGKITLESRTNTLIVTDTKSNLIKIGRIIENLDKITPQVLIESKIIETTLDSDDKLGIDWTIRVTAQGAKRPATIPFTPGGDQRWMKNVFPPAGPTDTNFPTGRPHAFPHPAPEFKDGAMIGDFVFGTLDFTSFQAVLEILNSRSDTKIVSNPSITTINNKEAKILVGTIVPIPIYEWSKEAGTRIIAGYIDQEVGIKLLVTPNINQQDYITLDVKPSVDEITGWTGPDNERPIISTRTAETKVMIKDGQTLVIGGLIYKKTIKSKKRVPILGYIPILDYFFSKKEDTVDTTDLLIFITPHIVREGRLSPEQAAEL